MMTLSRLAPYASLLALLSACNKESSDRKFAGPDQRFGCVADDKTTFGELNESEARCLCRNSVDAGREVLACFDQEEIEYEGCDSTKFKGYESSCDVALDDWIACRTLLAESADCDEAEQRALRFVDEDWMGCGTIIDRVFVCADEAAGLKTRANSAELARALLSLRRGH